VSGAIRMRVGCGLKCYYYTNRTIAMDMVMYDVTCMGIQYPDFR
jgi:hypothetical protein